MMAKWYYPEHITSYFKKYADMYSLFFFHTNFPADWLKEIYLYLYICMFYLDLPHDLQNSFTLKYTIRTKVKCYVLPPLQYAAQFPKVAAYQDETSGSRSQQAV
jgi:hypothetical protein